MEVDNNTKKAVIGFNGEGNMRFYGLVAIGVMVFFCILCEGANSGSESHYTVNSPGKNVMVAFDISDGGQPFLRVTFQDKTIIPVINLGVLFQDSTLFQRGITVKEVIRQQYDETYSLVAGKSDNAVNHCNEITVSILDNHIKYRVLEVVIRAYNDGIAFRYAFPEQPGLKDLFICGDMTEYIFPTDHACWPALWETYWNSNEKAFPKMQLSNIDPAKLIASPLILQRDDGITIGLMEANLTDYAGMYFQKKKDHKTAIKVTLVPRVDDPEICVKAQTPHVSPWRVIMIGDCPGDLIESNMILNLNEPCKIQDPSWVIPGKVIFPWWPDFQTGVSGVESRNTYENQRVYIDFASRNGIAYLELEPPWYGPEKESIENPDSFDITNPLEEIQLPKLIQYANKKNVGILGWVHWKSLQNQMDEALALYEKWGFKGIKVDFMDRLDQQMVNFYHAVAKKAADHHLLVYFHGAYTPTGMRRTWPNVLTREGVLGNEYNKWSESVTPEHTVTIPFTRMIPGPMDFTPGGFRNVTSEEFKQDYQNPSVMGTRAHQLAMFVVYESPLQMVCDYPGAYKGQSGFEFIQRVPASWDETKVIAGEIGQYIIIARRKDQTWYVGAMTDSTSRQHDLKLSFLNDSNYRMTAFADDTKVAGEPTRILKIEKIVSAKDVISITMSEGGGFTAYFTPAVDDK